jgi:glycerol-3-phosphate dehydrogenase (NAD(P)+)
MAPSRVAVLGCGSWGTALALRLGRNGHRVALWGHDPDQVAELIRDGENRRLLPGFAFGDSVEPVTDLGAAVEAAELCLVAVPSHGFASVVDQLPVGHIRRIGLTWATKGLDPQSGTLLHTIAGARLADTPFAVVSGPSFAAEVARNLPTAVTVASNDPALAGRLAGLLHGGRFRAYTSTDLVGVEISGAAKNVLAIATGIADGLGFGANTRAALITRGLSELMRLGSALGGERETFMGLAGVGDLVLTCTDNQSRNRRMGLALARGLDVEAAKREIGQEVEGVVTAGSIHALAGRLGIEMPISEQVHRVLYEGASPLEATAALLDREPKAEFL